MTIFSKRGGKINKVSRRHARKAFVGGLASLFSKPGSKNDKRGRALYYVPGKKW